MANFLAGVANAYLYNGINLIATAKTLIDSSITIGVTAEDLRGGKGNQLLGRYFHDSTFSIAMTDAMFRLEYIALQTGSTIKQGGDIYTTETVTLGADGAGTVSGTPVDFAGFGIIGWVNRPSDDVVATQVAFNGKGFTYPGGVEGENVCVRYVETDVSARQMVVSANFVPATLRVVLEATIWAGDSGAQLEQATIAGKLFVEIPRFQLDGSQEIALSSSGLANAPLSGMALRSMDAAAGCDADGYYAIITEQLFGINWYDSVSQLAIEGGDVSVGVGATKSLRVYAIKTDGTAFIAPAADLTFTSGATSTATVDTAGVITGVAAGSTTVTVAVTEKPEIVDVTTVTVTA